MSALDASVTVQWFVLDKPLVQEAVQVLDEIGENPSQFVVPDWFMNELLAVLCRLPERRTSMVRESLELVEALGISRIGNGPELLALAADLAGRWTLSGYDAVYVAPAELTGGAWLAADVRAARRVGMPRLVQVLGSRISDLLRSPS